MCQNCFKCCTKISLLGITTAPHVVTSERNLGFNPDYTVSLGEEYKPHTLGLSFPIDIRYLLLLSCFSRFLLCATPLVIYCCIINDLKINH